MNVKDALVLEEHEQIMLVNGRTRRAIERTYTEKSSTKKRRKLPGKRSWKNKTTYYAKLEGQMAVKQFNSKKKANDVLEKLFLKRQKDAIKEHAKLVKKRNKHSLRD